MSGKVPQYQQIVINPDLKATFDEFINTGNTLPLKKKSVFTQLLSQINQSFFHFSQTESKKIKRLLSYAYFCFDEYCRSTELKSNVILILALTASFLIPKKLISKTFAALGLLFVKTQYLDMVFFYDIISHIALSNTFAKQNQQCRNILNFYALRRLKNEENESSKKLLTDLVEQIQDRNSKYQTFIRNQHLL